MATIIIKKRNYSAPLPTDFYQLKSLTRLNDKSLTYKQFYTISDHNCEYFMIGKDRFFFSGQYSRRLLIKWVQKFKEYLFPIKYKIEYISISEAKQK